MYVLFAMRNIVTVLRSYLKVSFDLNIMTVQRISIIRNCFGKF